MSLLALSQLQGIACDIWRWQPTDRQATSAAIYRTHENCLTYRYVCTYRHSDPPMAWVGEGLAVSPSFFRRPPSTPSAIFTDQCYRQFDLWADHSLFLPTRGSLYKWEVLLFPPIQIGGPPYQQEVLWTNKRTSIQIEGPL